LDGFAIVDMYKELLQIRLAFNESVYGNITKRFRKNSHNVLFSILVHMGRKAVKMRTAASRAKKKAQVTEPVGLHDIADIELSDTAASPADIELSDTEASPADIEQGSNTIEVSHYLKDLQPQTCRS
jgi:hypothetical protein